MLGLIPPWIAGLKPTSTTLPKILCKPLYGAKSNLCALTAAELDCIELRGLKQAGGFLTGDPLASSPYPKAFRVSTSEEFQPSRCGASKLARLKPRINRAPSYFVHLRTGNQRYYCNILLIARIFLPPINNFRRSLERPLLRREALFSMPKG